MARNARLGTRRVRRRGWWAAVAESVDTRLWPVPLAAVIVSVILGVLLTRVDVILDSDLPAAVDAAVFNGGADTARSVLSSIAGSLITATSLTFSLTVIALQLASSQASPRVLRLFARDRQVHWTLAAFLGTFAYSITVLRSVRSDTDDVDEFVPRISVTIAFVLTLVSVVMLVFFLAHLAAQLRVETMLKDIHAETDQAIDRVGERNSTMRAFPHPIPDRSIHQTVTSSSSGFITTHDRLALLQLADEHGIVVQEITGVGENIVEGMPLAGWWPRDDGHERVDVDAIRSGIRDAFAIGYERTASEDIDYGVQQTLDIALRALSAGVNDPTTAVHALGHLSAMTTRMVDMPQVPRGLRGESGDLCVVTVAPGPADRIEAALSPIRHYCTDHPAVVARFVQATQEVAALSDDADVTTTLIAQLDALEEQLRADASDPTATARSLASISEARTLLGR